MQGLGRTTAYGHRRQRAQGSDTAPFAEVSGAAGAVTVGHVAAAGAPSMTTSWLADAAGDAVTVEFLVEWALLEPEEQERIRMVERRKRERRKNQEEKQNLEGKETKEAKLRSLFPSLAFFVLGWQDPDPDPDPDPRL